VAADAAVALYVKPTVLYSALADGIVQPTLKVGRHSIFAVTELEAIRAKLIEVGLLVPQPLPDAMGRVPLLPGSLQVFVENLANDRQNWLDLRPVDRPLPLVPRWLLIRQNLLQRRPLKLVNPTGLTLANLPR